MYVAFAGWFGWLPILARIFRKMLNFRKYVWRKLWLTWVTCRVLKKCSSRVSIFENMCVISSGWLGWLAIMDSCEVQFSKMYVSQILLKLVTCHSLASIFSRGSIQNMYVVIDGWLGWLAVSRKTISRKNQFLKYMCCQSWLTWLTCQFSPTNLR